MHMKHKYQKRDTQVQGVNCNVSQLYNIVYTCLSCHNDKLLVDLIVFISEFIHEYNVPLDKFVNYEMQHKLLLENSSLREYVELCTNNVNYVNIIAYCLDAILNMCINIDYKHKDISLSNSQRILLSMATNEAANQKQYIFIQHYYRGIGGDESVFFINDHIKLFTKFINYLLDNKILTRSLSSQKRSIYNINVSNINELKHFAVLLCLLNEGPIVRVQREPVNDVRIHTSTIGAGYICCLNYVRYREYIVNEICDIKNCRVDTYRSSGAGGQHVNKTNSAIRLTNNILTDVVSTAQDNRSQIENKKMALNRMKESVFHMYDKLTEDILEKNSNKTDRNYKNETMNMKRGKAVYTYACVNNFVRSLCIDISNLYNVNYSVNLLKCMLRATLNIT